MCACDKKKTSKKITGLILPTLYLNNVLKKSIFIRMASEGPFTFIWEALAEEVHSDGHQGQQGYEHVHQVEHCLVVQVAEGRNLRGYMLTPKCHTTTLLSNRHGDKGPINVHRNGPLGRFDLVVAMSVCSLCVPFSCTRFWGLFCPHFPKSDVQNF